LASGSILAVGSRSDAEERWTGCSPAWARVPARSGSSLHIGDDAVLLGACGGDDEVRRDKASSMVVVAWTNLLRGLAEGWLEGGRVCGDAGLIAAD
jgi:hypothetical protein